MCEYHLRRSRSVGKVERLVVKREGGETVTDHQLVEGNGVELVEAVREEKKRLEAEEVILALQHVSVTASGRKRKCVKRYGDDDDEVSNVASKKKAGNAAKKKKKKKKEEEEEVRVVKRVRVGSDEELLPDHLRCTRTDGKTWRCYRRIKDGATLCENHYIQGRLRQVRAVVPESLKLQRRDRVSLLKCSQLQVLKTGAGKRKRPVKWRPWSEFSEALDDALRRLQLKKSDMELQLLKAYLKRRAEKLERQRQVVGDGYRLKEVTKDLLFGAMTISASPALQATDLARPPCNVKIGSDPDSLSGVSFRSKNIEPVSIGPSKVMPGVREMAKLKRTKKRCHLCNKLGARLTQCSTCKKELFCIECIKERYFTSREDVEKSCPVCRKECSCEVCLANRSKNDERQVLQGNLSDKKRMEKVTHFRQLVHLLLPVLKHVKNEQTIELELEALIKGTEQSEVCIQQVENGCSKPLYCKNCRSCILDVHRSCEDCSYYLCLNCSRDLSEGLTKGMGILLSKYLDRTKNRKRFSRELLTPSSSPYWKFGVDYGSICCPPIGFGGCGHGLLVLKRVLSSSWINELEEKAAEVALSPDCSHALDGPSEAESDTLDQVQKAASRQNADDNFLYCPSKKNDQPLCNFHKHWRKHRPVVVHDVLPQISDLRWDPIFIFRSYLERCSVDSADAVEVEASNFLNWCEVEIGIRQSYTGQSKGWSHASMWDETLKLKGRLSSHIFRTKFPDHYARILHCLPYQEYTNPEDGISNLAINLPQEVSKPDLGPCVHISYGIDRDSAGATEKLCYNSYDLVNIMVHAAEVPVSSEQVTQVRKLMEKKWRECQEGSARMTGNAPAQKKRVKKGDGIKGDGIKGDELLNKTRERVTTACEGESGESCDSVVVHEPSGRSADNVNRHRESGSDSEASNLCSEKSDDRIAAHTFRNGDAAEESPSVSGGAEWDIFRREDVPVLVDYLKKHSSESSQINAGAGPPVLGWSVFLDSTDKRRLKEEFNIEPWTLKQRVGEAVIVPAGCPYQTRTLKSCVSVAFDFVSPESAGDSIHLSDELSLLPEDHVSNEDKLEVRKMSLYNISAALQQLRQLTSSG
uniref:Lysine-specific demethylase JMJ25 n=1 Tax=Kalanchoe fedtschenkoi TaxID=63787 RepID=A0A7N0UJJ8_KALFE